MSQGTGSPLAALARRYIAPQWRAVAGLGVALLGATGVQLALPRLLARFIDGASTGANTDALSGTAITYLVLAAAGQLLGMADVYLGEHVGLVATNGLRADMSAHLLRLDLKFHSSHRPGELIQRVDGDVASLGNFFGRFLVAIIGNALLLAGVLVVLMTVDWRLGATLAVVAVVVLYAVYRMRTFGRPFQERFMEAQADQAGFLEEHLAATEDLRSSGATAYAMRRFYEHGRAVMHHQRQAVFFGVLGGASASAALRVGTAVALAGASWLFRRGEASIGDVYLVFAYTEMLIHPIQVITRNLGDLQTAAAAVGRVRELLDTEPAITDGPGVPIPPAPLDVELDGVTFRYEADGDRPVLDDVSVRVAGGRVLGLLGRTGSGKTTIARLLVRFHDPDAGTVLLGGVDVRDATLAEVRDRVGLVTQEVQLFHASARDNLTLFDDGIADDRIVAVLDDLGMSRWFAALPDGLDTVLSSAGSGLSAGEAQLLAFARVFLRDPAVVILDEATARLDPDTEERVEHAIARLFEGRTAIVIAHRLRTVMQADEILVLEDGRVAEHGERRELASDPGSRFSELLRVGLEEVS